MVFADSSGFIAAFHSRDARYREAAVHWRAIAEAGEPVLTTALVLAETVTQLRRRVDWAVARSVGNAILHSAAMDLALETRAQLEGAWRELLHSGDPKLSFCDALSFVVMREHGVKRAFTFDRHFADAGFEVVPALARP